MLFMEVAPNQNLRDELVREWGLETVVALEDLAAQHDMGLMELLSSTPIEELQKIAESGESSVA